MTYRVDVTPARDLDGRERWIWGVHRTEELGPEFSTGGTPMLVDVETWRGVADSHAEGVRAASRWYDSRGGTSDRLVVVDTRDRVARTRSRDDRGDPSGEEVQHGSTRGRPGRGHRRDSVTPVPGVWRRVGPGWNESRPPARLRILRAGGRLVVPGRLKPGERRPGTGRGTWACSARLWLRLRASLQIPGSRGPDPFLISGRVTRPLGPCQWWGPKECSGVIGWGYGLDGRARPPENPSTGDQKRVGSMPGKRLSEASANLNVLGYGPPGSGKTTGALTMANLGRGRVFLVDAEGGAKAAALRKRGVNVDNIDIWPDHPGQLTYSAIEDVYMDLRESDEYVGYVIDSMTELNRRLLEDIVGAALAKAERLGKPRDRFQINLEDYGVVSNQMRTLLRRFRDLPGHLMLTALERRDVDDDSKVSYGPALGPAMANDTMGLVDVVVYHTVESIGGQTFYTGISSPANRRKAKDRFAVLPGRMVDPTAERMLAYLEGTLTKKTDPRQDAARRAARGPEPEPAVEAAKEADVTVTEGLAAAAAAAVPVTGTEADPEELLESALASVDQ